MSDNTTPSVYMVRADYTRYAPAFINGGYVGIGFLDNEDLSHFEKLGKDWLRTQYEHYHPNESKMSTAQNVGQIWRFLSELTPGTFVVTPLPDDSQLQVGRIISDYYFQPNPTDSRYSHRKHVEWFKEPLRRSALSIPAQNTLRSLLTIFQVSQYEEILAPYAIDLPQRVQRVISTQTEINRAILDEILSLSAEEFEILVKELLTAVGFDAEHTGKSGDGGVDVKGKLRVYEFATVDLMVQVKRYTSGKISHQDIQRFRSSVPERTQAAFVTTSDFTSKARDEAERDGFKKIGLINGMQFVDILIERYDDLSEEVRNQLNLKKTLLPGTK
jgi:restriction system protein